jgi:hypothetical protein
LSIVQGPVSVAPCQTLISRFATFSSPYPAGAAEVSTSRGGESPLADDDGGGSGDDGGVTNGRDAVDVTRSSSSEERARSSRSRRWAAAASPACEKKDSQMRTQKGNAVNRRNSAQ